LERHLSVTVLRHGETNPASGHRTDRGSQLSISTRPASGPEGLTRVRSIIEVLLVLVLAAQAARLVWLLLGPGLPPPRAPSAAPQSDLTVLTRFNPFAGQGAAAGPAATGDGLRLYGVRAGGDGQGSAIIGTPDGKQTSYAVGETIAPGVTLRSVQSDHVVLSRGGAPSRLFFPNADN